MTFTKFQEYLNSQNKLVTAGKVKTIADFEGTVDHKPAKEKKHKHAGGKGQVGEAKPYIGSGTPKDPNKGKNHDGFASKGDKSLEYNPKSKVPAKVGEGGDKKATWPKTKTQEWIDNTKNMSLAEFTKNMRAESLKGLDECACQEPHSSIKDAVNVCKCNEKYISALVREMKRNNMFEQFFEEMSKQPESWTSIAKLMENEFYARKLAKIINEMVAPPMGDSPLALPAPKKKKHVPMGDDMGMGLDAPEDDMSDNPDDMGDEDPDMDSGDLGDDDNVDSDSDDLGDDPDMGSDDMGDDQHGDMGGDMGSPDMNMPPPKKKKFSGADHLMNAMKNHPAMSMKTATKKL